MGIPAPPIQKEAMQFLQGQPWPGNVRELENAVRRALLVRPGYPITLSDVHQAMAFSVPETSKHETSLAALVRENLGRAARGEPLGVYAEMLGIMERELFLQAIKLARGNQVQAARWLGISRLTLRHRLRGLGLDGATLKTNLG
jgi:DNA-binding NtrC family response regulator